MYNSVQKDFDDFIKKITLNKKEKEDIIEKHNHLTDMVKQAPPVGYKIVKTRLSGSYAKHTVLNEYDETKLPDVDVILLIEANDKSVDDINSDFLTYFEAKKGKVALNVRQQSNSIGIIYSNISVDMVIGVIENDILKITSDKKHDWLETNCLKHIEYMEARNKDYEGFCYYDLVKLIKYLNKEVLEHKLKSYTLEQVIHQCAPKDSVGLRIYQAFSKTLDNISNLTSITDIRDCCDKNKNGYDEKDEEIFVEFIEEIRNYYQMSQEALTGNRKKWQEIFGERFPEQPNTIVKNEGEYDKTQTPYCLK